jgi:hypothetical protein
MFANWSFDRQKLPEVNVTTRETFYILIEADVIR